jgi:hypothetical protein
MDGHRRFRGVTALAALSAALVVSAIAPSLASGQNIVGDVLQGLGLGGQSGGAAPRQEEGTGYQPPLHGTNPHGQGTVGTGDFLPDSELPYAGDPTGEESGEEVVIGRSRGEKTNPYHGHVTILSVFGNEIAGVDTGPGESEEFNPLNALLLAEICAESEGALCLGILEAESETTENSSQNHFRFFGFSSNSEFGHLGVNLFESNGNIEEDQTCQRSEGNSEAAHISAGQNGDVSNSASPRLESDGFEAKVASSSAESQACNNSAPTQTNDSSVFEFNGEDVSSCEDETLFDFGLVAFICNADDTNGVGEEVQQAPVPYGVREAFNVFVLPFFLFPDEVAASEREIEGNPLALIKATVAASESHAVAPPVPPTIPTTPGTAGVGGQAGQQGGGPEDQGGGPNGPVATTAGPGTGDLAFTGTDVLILGLIGAGLVMAGLTATRLAVRKRRATA